MTAIFELKTPYGTKRYYPRNKTAELLVKLKVAGKYQKRKAVTVTLNSEEIKIVEELGIIVQILEKVTIPVTL